VKQPELSEYADFAVPVLESDAYYCSQNSVETLCKAVGNTLHEKIEGFLPQVLEGGNKLGQVSVAGGHGFEIPCGEESGCLLSAANLHEDGAVFLLEQIQRSKLGTWLHYFLQLLFLQERRFRSIPYQNPAASLDHRSRFGKGPFLSLCEQLGHATVQLLHDIESVHHGGMSSSG